MRALAIDYGDKRIGIAISDPLKLTAHGLKVIKKGSSFKEDLREISDLLVQYPEIDEIIIGLPKRMPGDIGPQAEKVLKFVDELKGALSVNLLTWDERLTTAEAERTLIEAGLSRKKRKKVIDKSAAQVILQSYLNRSCLLKPANESERARGT